MYVKRVAALSFALFFAALGARAQSEAVLDLDSAAKLKEYFAAKIAENPQLAPVLQKAQNPIEELTNSCNNVAVQQKKVDTAVLMQPSSAVTRETISTLRADAQKANDSVTLALKRSKEFSTSFAALFHKDDGKAFDPNRFADAVLLGAKKKGCDVKFLEKSIPYFQKIVETSDVLVSNWASLRVEEGQFTLPTDDLQSKVDAAREEIYRLENDRYEYAVALRKSVTK